MLPSDVTPQLVANDGVKAMQRAIADPDAYAIEPKVDGVRGLIVFREDHVVEARNRRGLSRDWLRFEPFRRGIHALARRLPILWQGSVLDGELTAGRFSANPRSFRKSNTAGSVSPSPSSMASAVSSYSIRSNPTTSVRALT
jgi:hypothetical protein